MSAPFSRGAPYHASVLLDLFRNAEAKGTLSEVLRVNIAATRPGPKGVSYFPIQIFDAVKGAWTDFCINFLGESLYGGIDPVLAEDCAAIKRNDENGRPIAVLPRDKAPCLKVAKYVGLVKTDKDGISLAGPPPEQKSTLFAVLEYIDQTFRTTLEAALHEGKISIRASPGVIRVPNTKVVGLVQRTISDSSASRNAGKELPNPFVRMKIQVEEKGGKNVRIPIYDYSSRRDVNGRPEFNLLLAGGQPLTDYNLHTCFGGGMVVDGQIRIEGCFSNMGMSSPISLVTLIVHPRAAAADPLESLYMSEPAAAAGSAGSASAATGAATGAVNSTAAVATTVVPPVATLGTATPADVEDMLKTLTL